jgi:putative peptidoglycan lipid II flippase
VPERPRPKRAGAGRAVASPAHIEDSLGFTESTPALAGERVLSRAAESPLVRGGLSLMAGVLTGNLLGFVRVAVTAYLLGTHSAADSLAVAMGPADTLNNVLINSMLFAFVPMLTACSREERTALLLKLNRLFAWVFAALSAVLILAAPWLMRALAPGLDPHFFPQAVNTLRILALSTMAAGTGAIYCALLYTDRRFAPTAFYQAALNIFTVICALGLWKWMGVYAFALGYTVGAWAQVAIVYFASRSSLEKIDLPECRIPWREIVGRPAFFVVYAAGLGLNIVFTRAYATHAGAGMAAALDYCMRGVGVPMALLVSPLSNSLLPEIARLRSLFRIREALRLIDKTVALAAVMAAGGCGFALAFREPAVRLFFQHGNFTAESTAMVSAVFLGLGPSLVGWSLLEIASRSLFALDRPWLPVIAALVPVAFNVAFTLWLRPLAPQWIGVGSSIGLMLGFAALFAMAHLNRKRWLLHQ